MLRKAGALSALVGIALLALESWSSAYALTGPGVIRVTASEVRRVRIDLGRRGLTAGDVEVTRRLLFNKRITQRAIGHSDVTCTDTGTGSMSCTGTYFLPRGKIMVGGVVASRLFYELAVYGGTGLYNNARGSLTVTFLGGLPAQELLVFRLAG